MEIEHIGYLSRDIETSLNKFRALGFIQDSEIIEDINTKAYEGRGIRICFIRNAAIRIELVQPICKNTSVYTMLKKVGEGPYHICYQVENLENSICELTEQGWMLISNPAPAIAFNYARVAFLFNNGVGLIELVETTQMGKAV